jgi:nucleotidyltransferase/DNA polymerase involved in DNA repair
MNEKHETHATHDSRQKPERVILHVDMDAFYASIEQLDDPTLKGRPVIVGADPRQGLGRGVVAACSYEARKFGVRSALPISRAWKLCPAGAFVRPRMERYVEVSHEVMEVLRRFTNLVEPLSIDEAFLDVTGSTALFGAPIQIARAVKKQIREATGLTASAGVAPNKFLAKIASDLKKPDGLVVVEPGEVETFLADLPISRLWGVGPKTEIRLREMGLHTIGAVRARKQDDLTEMLGSNLGAHLYHLAMGHDDRPVIPNWEPKSISNETTFEEDTRDRELLVKTIRRLAESVGRRLRRENYRARKVSLKVRLEPFETHTRQISVKRPVDTDEEIIRLALSLFDQFSLDRRIRLIGVGTGDIVRPGEGPTQLGLFDEPRKDGVIDRTVDAIRERFGEDLIQRGSAKKR